jgi:hypothetical protein
MPPLDLRCEYRSNPLGLDVTQPRLSWKLADDRRGARQTAYQVLAAANPGDLAAGRDLLWDSGRVESAESVHVPTAPGGQVLLDGQALESAIVELSAGSYEFRVLNRRKA